MIHSKAGATPHSHTRYDAFRSTAAWIARYLASYNRAGCISHTQAKNRFTILEVAVNWHELMISQSSMQPSTLCLRKKRANFETV